MTKLWTWDFYFSSFLSLKGTKECAFIGKLSGVMNLNPPQLALSCHEDVRERLQGVEPEGASQSKVSGKRETEGEGPGEFERRQKNKARKGRLGEGPGAKGDRVAAPKTHQVSPIKALKLRP